MFKEIVIDIRSVGEMASKAEHTRLDERPTQQRIVRYRAGWGCAHEGRDARKGAGQVQRSKLRSPRHHCHCFGCCCIQFLIYYEQKSFTESIFFTSIYIINIQQSEQPCLYISPRILAQFCVVQFADSTTVLIHVVNRCTAFDPSVSAEKVEM